MPIKKVFHFCITVPDIEKSLKWYEDVLGLKSAIHIRNGTAPGKLLGFPGEMEFHADHLVSQSQAALPNPHETATVIDLIEWVRPKTIIDGGPYKDMNHVGIPRMAFDVEGIDDMIEDLRSKGVEFNSDPVYIDHGDDLWAKCISFRDPDGIMLELVEFPYKGERK